MGTDHVLIQYISNACYLTKNRFKRIITVSSLLAKQNRKGLQISHASPRQMAGSNFGAGQKTLLSQSSLTVNIIPGPVTEVSHYAHIGRILKQSPIYKCVIFSKDYIKCTYFNRKELERNSAPKIQPIRTVRTGWSNRSSSRAHVIVVYNYK